MQNQMNLKLQSDFISVEEQQEVIAYSAECLKPKQIDSPHVRKINELTMGGTVLCDFSNNEITKKVIPYQGGGTFIETVPDLYYKLANRIAAATGVSDKNVFFQCILIGAGGTVHAHYDAGVPGYVTYKCNIYIEGDDDTFYAGGEPIAISPRSLYCFEANLYKHWMDVSEKPRIHLSYGFIVPNEDLGWEKEAPRIRLSERIWKRFMTE